MHSSSPTAIRLQTSWATTLDQVREAQRLRHSVFAVEMGARLAPPPDAPTEHDCDRFDSYAEHLLVRACTDDRDPAECPVVGTYRVLTPTAARRAGGFYSETQFDCRSLDALRPRMLEFGRSCIAPAHRTGGTILALWSALGDFMRLHGLDHAFGSASVPLKDGVAPVAALWRKLSALHLAPAERRVVPFRPIDLVGSNSLRFDDCSVAAATPPLVKGYLRTGAELLGAPAYDPDFCTADLPMLMALEQLPQRHRRRFLERETADAVA
jgi:putative hemolysin